jgi:hypothetical protein
LLLFFFFLWGKAGSARNLIESAYQKLESHLEDPKCQAMFRELSGGESVLKAIRITAEVLKKLATTIASGGQVQLMMKAIEESSRHVQQSAQKTASLLENESTMQGEVLSTAREVHAATVLLLLATKAVTSGNQTAVAGDVPIVFLQLSAAGNAFADAVIGLVDAFAEVSRTLASAEGKLTQRVYER